MVKLVKTRLVLALTAASIINHSTGLEHTGTDSLRSSVRSSLLKTPGSFDVPGVGKVTCKQDGDINLCLGIRFGQAPIGDLRFRAPKPAREMAEIDATNFGDSCYQPGMYAKEGAPNYLPMSEDCLNLDIYAPADAKDAPVFLYTYGGGGVSGANRQYNGTSLARSGIIAVFINYRLGPFGFLPMRELAEEPGDDHGNGGANGLLDQLLGFKWVNKHISAFGGNPNEVTIAGESFGASLTCAHMYFPMSQPYFNKVYLSSGGCRFPGKWGTVGWLKQNNLDIREKFFKDLNTSSLSELRRLPAETLLTTGWGPVFMPSKDGYLMKCNPALLPLQLKNKAVILSGNTGDGFGAFPWTQMLNRAPDPSNENQIIEKLSPFGSEGDIKKLLSYFSYNDKTSPEEFGLLYGRIVSLATITCPLLTLAEELTKGGNTVRTVKFGYINGAGPLRGYVPHGSDMSYMFNDPQIAEKQPQAPYSVPFLSPKPFNKSLGEFYSGMIANFVKSGIPWGKWGTFEQGENLNVTNTEIEYAYSVKSMPNPDTAPCEVLGRMNILGIVDDTDMGIPCKGPARDCWDRLIKNAKATCSQAD